MIKLNFFSSQEYLKILCLGAHPDDIEIGCGGTLLRMIAEVPNVIFYWVVFSGNEKRRKEAVRSADIFLKNVEEKKLVFKDFKESYFSFFGAEIKDYFEELKDDFSPDIVFTHYRNDAHQDHRLISSLTWNTYRNNLIWEYEIPKYDGDLGIPNLYVQIEESAVKRKVALILESFSSQLEKQWFTEETFKSILRIRGVESNSPSKYAEAFHCRKVIF